MVPRPLVRHFADRYMAGETLADAVATVSALNGIGAAATVDVLGEFVHDVAQCQATADEYVALLDAIARERLDANVSIKLTGFGLKLDPQQHMPTCSYDPIRHIPAHSRCQTGHLEAQSTQDGVQEQILLEAVAAPPALNQLLLERGEI